MNVLVSNDDGIFAPGLWTLVRELKTIARVIVVAPDREQSAIGTAVTLRQPLRVQRVAPLIPDVETYTVEGTPSDSVILALGKLVTSKVDMVITGINQGSNLGDDALISGTVSAALQGYLRGFPALAISVTRGNNLYLEDAARLAALLAKRICSDTSLMNVLLNVNLPNLPLVKIKGVKITRLANKNYIDIVEEGHDGIQEYYWLVRQGTRGDTDRNTDLWAIENDNISITPLHTIFSDKRSLPNVDSLYSGLLGELRG